MLGDDEVGVAGPALPRERDDVVGDRPALLRRLRVDESRHRRAVEPRAHRPEDILAGRSSPERPALREVRRTDRMLEVVHQRSSRRSVAATERAVALDAAGLDVELLPELDRLIRNLRRARERHGLRDAFGVREVGRESLDEVGDVRHFLVGERWPGGHRGVGHAAPDDVDEVLVGRQRPGRRRANLELAGRKVARPGEQVRRGVALAVTLLAVALRTELHVELLARLPLRVGTYVLSRNARPISSRHSIEAATTATTCSEATRRRLIRAAAH